MRRRLGPPTLVMITFVAGSAAADNSAVGIMAAVHNCRNPDIAPQARIDACTEVIHTNLASGDALATFYYNRGAAYEVVHNADLARKDYDKALQLRPDFPLAETGRARLARASAVSTPDEH